jgi:AraC family transcriptional regulator
MAIIEVKDRKPCRLAYVEHVGGYGKIPFDQYFAQLYGWAKEQRVRPGMPLGIYFDNPAEAPPEKCRSEIGIPFTGEGKAAQNIKVKEMPAMTVAVFKHKAPASQYQESYRKLSEWITQNGYEQTGPPIEIYTKKPKIVGNETIIYAHIQFPIRKK